MKYRCLYSICFVFTVAVGHLCCILIILLMWFLCSELFVLWGIIAICEDEDCEDDSEVESVDEAADIDDAGKMGAVTGEVLEEMNIEDPAVMSECVAEGIESQLSDSADFKVLGPYVLHPSYLVNQWFFCG